VSELYIDFRMHGATIKFSGTCTKQHVMASWTFTIVDFRM